MDAIITKVITEVAISLIGLAGTYALFLVGKARAKLHDISAKGIQDENQRKLVDTAFERVSILANNIVAQTQQVSVDAIKKAIEDGKLDKTELQVLGKQAVESVYGQLNSDMKALLETELTDVKGYIESVVEKEVLALKNKTLN